MDHAVCAHEEGARIDINGTLTVDHLAEFRRLLEDSTASPTGNVALHLEDAAVDTLAVLPTVLRIADELRLAGFSMHLTISPGPLSRALAELGAGSLLSFEVVSDEPEKPARGHPRASNEPT